MLAVALILGLRGRFARDLHLVRRVQPGLAARTITLLARLHALPSALPTLAGCGTTPALPITVRVLLQDPARRDRLCRHVGGVLRHCVAALGAPDDTCAVIVMRELEREGQPLKGCVERLSYPDGTCRTIVSVSVWEGDRELAFDEIAARLIRYYPAVTAAERAVIVADGPPAPVTFAGTATPRATRPLHAALAPVPTGQHPGATRVETPASDAGRAHG